MSAHCCVCNGRVLPEDDGGFCSNSCQAEYIVRVMCDIDTVADMLCEIANLKERNAILEATVEMLKEANLKSKLPLA